MVGMLAMIEQFQQLTYVLGRNCPLKKSQELWIKICGPITKMTCKRVTSLCWYLMQFKTMFTSWRPVEQIELVHLEKFCLSSGSVRCHGVLRRGKIGPETGWQTRVQVGTSGTEERREMQSECIPAEGYGTCNHKKKMR